MFNIIARIVNILFSPDAFKKYFLLGNFSCLSPTKFPVTCKASTFVRIMGQSTENKRTADEAHVEIPTSRNSKEDASPFDTSKYKSFEQSEDYGYYFYPERGEAKVKTFWENLWSEGRGRKFKCEANVTWCVENHPMVKLMMRALKSRGCEVNLRRHIACEPCIGYVNGGFDPNQNQVVVCQNTAKKKWLCCNVLAHEFIHAFDYCRAKVNFMDLRHLACTEIRAANFMHCSFMAAFSAGVTSPLNIKQTHADCVKNQAVKSMVIVRNISSEAAMEIVNSVFHKCYNDLEPVGRIPRKASRDTHRALIEGQMYGYTD